MTQLLIAFIALVMASVSGFSTAVWAGWGVEAWASSGVSVFLISWFLMHMVILQPMAMWKEHQVQIAALKAQIDSYEKVDLQFVFRDGVEPYVRDIFLGDGQLGERLWRVGINGCQARLTQGVVVRLEAIEPGIRDLPQILHPKESPWQGLPTTWAGDGSFDVRSSETMYVDVLRYRPSYGQERDRLELVLQTYDFTLPFQSHILTLTDREKEGRSETKKFRVEVNPHDLTRFYPLDAVTVGKDK